MTRPRVALMTFGDAREHEWQNLFQRLTEPRHRQIAEYLGGLPIELHHFDQVARTKTEIDAQVDALKTVGVEVFVVHLPCWTAPNLVVRGVQRMNLPTALVSNRHPGTHGTVGLLGAAGALAQIGYPHLRVRESYDGSAIADRLLPFLRAAAAVGRLRGKVFGLFGGRSLGIDTGSFDPMQWRASFGIDVEHIDQLEIIRRADQVSDEAAQDMVSWLEMNVGQVGYDGERLTPERLAYQAKCYLATKEIIEEFGLDFVAVKCMPDLTNNYAPQCLSAAFLPGPFDAQGDKAPVTMACEADGDGALTMEILKEVSGGMPVLFGDLSYINEETSTLYLPNCGAMCGWYAGRSEDASENLKQIELIPSFRPAGGATVFFKAAPGPLTLARLYRKAGAYTMAIIPGTAIEPSSEEYQAFIQARGSHQLPTAFVRVKMDFDDLIAEFGSNHISGVAGDVVEELVQACKLLSITSVVIGERVV